MESHQSIESIGLSAEVPACTTETLSLSFRASSTSIWDQCLTETNGGEHVSSYDETNEVSPDQIRQVDFVPESNNTLNTTS